MPSSLLVAGAALAAYAAPALAAGVVTVDLTPRQTLTSFGASGAWWPNDLQYFPVEKQKELADFLFNPDGIWLSSYRYNVGANGGSDTHDCYTPSRVVQSPILTNGTYDFSRDAAGQRFLDYAHNHSVPYITFFMNAAPSYIASNQRAFGWTFTSNATEPYADYVAKVISHYTTERGMNISYISPMNEPDYLHPAGDQEGMNVPPDQRGTIFAAIQKALSSSAANSTTVIGDETSQPVNLGGSFGFWLPNATTAISHLAVHNYDYPDDAGVRSFYSSISSLTKNSPSGLPPVKFTEACCATSAANGPQVFGSEYDPTMVNALIVARQVWQFLTLAQAVSFDWWTAIGALPCSPTVDGYANCVTLRNATNAFNDGLVYIDPNYNSTRDFNLYFTKRTYMMKHLSHFIRPGSVRYDIDPAAVLPVSVTALAVRAPADPALPLAKKSGYWNLMFFNNATESQTFELEVPGGQPAVLVQVVETTAQVDFGAVKGFPPYTLIPGRMTVTLPPLSIWSMRFAGTRC